MKRSRAKIKLLRKATSLLKSGVSSFNSWRSDSGFRQLELSGLTLDNMSLDGVNLTNTRLRRAEFVNCTLCKAEFSGTNLNKASFLHADLREANLRQAMLVEARMEHCDLTGSNLFATSRDNWRVTKAVCSYCWITRDRQSSPDHPDVFQAREFELAYGGTRIKVRFPGGMTPVDLLALPFHIQRLREVFKDREIVLAGLSTIGEPFLEFRVSDSEPAKLQNDMQDAFISIAESNRHIAQSSMAYMAQMAQAFIQQAANAQAEAYRLAQSIVEHRPHPFQLFLGGNMDTYNVGQAVSVGPGASGHVQSMTQYLHSLGGIATPAELSTALREVSKALAEFQPSTKPTKDASTALEDAAVAVQKQDLEGTTSALARAGKVALDFASKVGAAVVAKAIENALQM